MTKPLSQAAFKAVRKPTPPELFVDRGTGTDFETRLKTWSDYLTPNDRFYIRSHSPTPEIDVAAWRLRIDGSGIRKPVELSYDQINAMRQITVTKAIECAGNARRFFKESFGKEAEGVQWRLGAVGVAEWTGVRLRDLLELAGITDGARDVMPEGLDDQHGRRPMPLAKALADDTILALAMNGEVLPPDHGYPARVVVPGWLGTASIKWVGRIQVATESLHVPWNTKQYVLAGPDYPAQGPAEGAPITEMPVVSLLELDWPATLTAGRHTIHGHAYAGEGCIRAIVYSIDNGNWRPATLLEPNLAGAGARFAFDWDAKPGYHEIRLRASDQRGRVQPDNVPWNKYGCCYNAVVAHPVNVC